MKTKETIFMLILLVLIITSLVALNYNEKIIIIVQNSKVLCENKAVSKVDTEIVYDGMTLNQLAEKLDKSLNSTVAGKGHIFAKYSIEYNVDPYLAVAVMLHETGCKWTCSSLAQKCYNYGGQKGTPSCNGGSYKKYETQEEGIRGYIHNLSKNYISKGLTTPELINKKYAADPNWHIKINDYVNEIKLK